jgi:DNA repair protein RecO (recombination protein O)
MSTLNITEALVLRTYSLGDADKIALFLTRANGVVRGVAKGARKMKSRFGAGLEPFTFVQLTYRAKEDKELVSIQQTEILQTFFPFAGNPETLTDWAYLGELIIALSPPHEPNPKLYDLAKSCMETLARRPEIRRPVRNYFSIWLLHLSGLLPGWNLCLRCHNPLAAAGGVYVDSRYHLYCENCRPAPARPFAPATYSLLTAARTNNPQSFAELGPAAAQDELEQLAQTLLAAAI